MATIQPEIQGVEACHLPREFVGQARQCHGIFAIL
jgi:hypothetical protein